MKKAPGSGWHLTRIGAVVVLVGAAAVVVAIFTSGGAQALALGVIAAMALILGGGVLAGNRVPMGLQQRREEFGAVDRNAGPDASDAGRDALWEREKALYDKQNEAD